MQLRVSNPQVSDEFVALLAAQDVKLPLRVCDEDVGVVFDADGRDVLTIDSNGERPDAQAGMIAQWIVLAVNTCGGFQADRRS